MEHRTSHRWRRLLSVVTAALMVITWLVNAAPASAAEPYLDLDISDQVLQEVVDGNVTYATHISSGSGEGYWLDGTWWSGETPRGEFRIYAKDPGWVQGSLGWLYNAMYFDGGFAIHGSTSVPDYPASHGCVRVTIDAADELFARIPVGMLVLIHD